MLHEPAASSGPDNASDYKTQLGIIMFIGYLLIYAGFVVINIVNPVLMEKIVFCGLNLAVVYGFGLIIFALLLALVYNAMCNKREFDYNEPEDKGGK
ncbi:DUF485 domain-containing protein [Thermoproteota archaeon]